MADDIVVRFGAETAGLETGAARAKAAIQSISPEIGMMQGILAELVSVTSIAAAGFAALAAATLLAIPAITKSAAALGASTQQLAEYFSDTTENIGRLRSIADAAGISAKKLGTALEDLSKNVKKGDEDTKNALKALGIGFDDLKGKDMQGMLAVLAKRFSEVKDSSNKTAAAEALLGKEGEKLIPILNKGADGLKHVADTAERTRTMLDEKMAAALAGTAALMKESETATSDLWKSFDGLGLAIFNTIKPAVDGFLMIFRDLIQNIELGVQWMARSVKEGNMMSFMFWGVSGALKVLASIIAGVVYGFQTLALIASQVAAQIGNIYGGLGAVFTALFSDIMAAASKFFTALLTSGQIAASGIGQALSSAGSAITSAFKGDFSGAAASLAQIKTDATASADGISKAFANIGGLEKTRAAVAKITGGISKDLTEFDAGIARTAKQLNKEIATIWGDGMMKNPEKKDDAGGSDKNKKKGNNDAARLAMAEIDGEIAALRAGLDRKVMVYEQDFKQKRISEQEKIALVQAATEEEFQAELALLKKKLEIDDLRPQQKQMILNQIAALENKHRADNLRLDYQSINAQKKAWEGYMNTVTTAINGQLRGLLAGTTSIAQAMKTIVGDLLLTWIQAGVKMAGSWVAEQMGMTAATATGAAARAGTEIAATSTAEAGKTAAVAAGTTARLGMEMATIGATIFETISAAFTKISAYAGEVIAAVTAWLAPIFGPAALPVAMGVGAATVAAGVGMVNSFDVGAWDLSRDQIAMVHKQEMIIPAGPAAALRSNLESLANGGGQGGGQGASVSLSVNLTAIDTRSGIQFLKGQLPELARMLKHHVNLNPSAKVT